jgi:hypothetical protein
LAIDRQRCSGQGRSSQRANIESFSAISETLTVSLKLFNISQPVMRGQYRLSSLEMSISRQHDIGVLLTSSNKGLLDFNQQLVEIVDGITSVELQVRGDLIVSTSPRVQLTSHITDPRDQRIFDVHVDVFEICAEGELSGGNLFTDLVKMITDPISFEVVISPA